MQNQKAYTIEEIALQTESTKTVIQKAVKDKKLEVTKLGRKVIVTDKQLENYRRQLLQSVKLQIRQDQMTNQMRKFPWKIKKRKITAHFIQNIGSSCGEAADRVRRGDPEAFGLMKELFKEFQSKISLVENDYNENLRK